MDLPPSLSRMVRTVPGEARTVIGLVAAFGLVLAVVVGVLVWWDFSHPDATGQAATSEQSSDR
jgi:hypothetical protein